MAYGIIYCATNRLNEKKYIGQTTKSLIARKRGHQLTMVGPGCEHSKFIGALRKHGWDAFDWQEIAQCEDQLELDSAERFFIRLWRTQEDEHGYNLSGGGGTGHHHMETRARMSASAKAIWASGKRKKPASYAKRGPLSAEHRKRVTEGLVGRVHSDETKRKMSEARKAYWAKKRTG